MGPFDTLDGQSFVNVRCCLAYYVLFQLPCLYPCNCGVGDSYLTPTNVLYAAISLTACLYQSVPFVVHSISLAHLARLRHPDHQEQQSL
jgi:hypothetical protein